jgi:hemolysin III
MRSASTGVRECGAMSERPQSPAEEIANSVSHGTALLAAIVAVPFLMSTARSSGIAQVIGAAVFAVTMVSLYATSTLYHALPAGRTKILLLKLDHCAICFFIAGSYTPFALGAASDSRGWTLFGLIWSAAIAAAALKALDHLSHRWISTGLYLVMGWLVLIAAMPLIDRVPVLTADLLLAGGVAYTVGVVFFVLDHRLRYSHAVWHFFVAAGSGCHLFAVLGLRS